MRAVNHTLRLSTATLLVMALGSYVFANEAKGSDVRNLSHVNKSVRVQQGERVGHVSSVNGSIRIDRDASAREVDTVNGRIELEDNTSIESADTVNGRIEVGRNVSVAGDLETVNGRISIRPESDVGGRVRTVNGKISLRGARVAEQIRTANGDIELRDGSVVEGDIVVRGNDNWLGKFFSFGREHRPEITIDASSSVLGTIHLHREVDLHIQDGAQVGEIIEY